MASTLPDTLRSDIARRDGDGEGEDLRQSRITVRIERRSTSPISPAAFAGGVAPLFEAIENKGLLGDAPPCVIELQLVQTKVENYYEQGVVVEITRS